MNTVTTLPDHARKALRAAMDGCADSKTAIPALQGVLIRTTPRGLEFIGTDLERVERAECDAKVTADMACVVARPRDLAQWLALADKGAVTLSLEATENGERLTFAQPGNVARFTTYSTAAYPMATATGASASAQPVPQPDRVTKWLPSTLNGDERIERREHYGPLHIRRASGAKAWDVVHTSTGGFITTCDEKAGAARLAHHMTHCGINWDSARMVPYGDKGNTRLELDGASMAIVGAMKVKEIKQGLTGAATAEIVETIESTSQPVAATPVTPPTPATPVKIQRAAHVPRTVSPVRLAEVAYNGRIYRNCYVEVMGTRAQCLIGTRGVNVPLSAIRWQ